MKVSPLIFLCLLAASAQAETRFASGRVLSTPMTAEGLPSSLSFTATKLSVRNAGWFSTLFPALGCAVQLHNELPANLELSALASHTLKISLNGHASEHLSNAYSSYIPVYHEGGRPVHPHFLIHVPGWVTFHLQIHKEGGKKHLVLSLIQGRPGLRKLVPVLEAEGV